MTSLPSGTVTFLLTDVEQSTPLWIQYPAQMRAVLARHDEIARACIAQAGGTLLKARGEGDSLFTVFADACDAAVAALTLQRAMCEESWDFPAPLRVRMALHTGEVEARDGDYYGLAVNLCARIRGVAHGGQILLSQTAADLVREHLPHDASLLDLGAHGLKDLQRPERLWQLQRPDLPADFPPLRSLAAYRNNLPRQLTSFIGRETDVAEAKSLLTQTSLLTLLGSGGCGKTRLALQAAADLMDDYPDGVWFVELAPLADPAIVSRAIAKTLGLAEEPGRDALDTLCAALQPQSALLILDNCEHLADAAARAANTLLRACPRLHVLATSRVRLNVPGETAWRVPSLVVPDDKTLTSVEAGMVNPALRLFVERAASAHPRFALTAANLPAATQICRRLDGIPLAIELAAARVNTLTVQQIAQRLDQSFKLLIGGGPTVLARHQTLQALIDWSHDLLSMQERVLLRRLAVFAGGWTLEACEAVCAWGEIETGDVLDLLTHLVDASLVIAEEQGEAHRYRLQETMRQYAQERLGEVGEDATARDRHFHYFLELAEEAEPQLIGAKQAQWLARLEVEHDNLRAALAWAVGGDLRLRLGGALWRFWATRYLSEGRSWLQGALAGSLGASALVRAKALNALGVLTLRQGEYTAAQNLLMESLAIREQAGRPQDIAEAHNNLGHVARSQADYKQALAHYEKGLAGWKAIGNTWGVAASLSNMGMVKRDLDDLLQARSCYEQALALWRGLQDEANIAGALSNLGMIHNDQEEYPQARDLFAESLSIYRQQGNEWGVAITLNNLADACYHLDGGIAAQPLFVESMTRLAALGDKTYIVHSFMGLGKIAAEQEDFRRAAQLLAALDALCAATGTPLPASERAQHTRTLRHIHDGLDDEQFTACWEQGAAMSLQELIPPGDLM